MSSSKLVLKSTTSTSLNDRFSKLMKNRPDDSSRVRDHSPFSFYFNFFLGQSLVDKSGAVRPGSEKNRRFAEELERRSSVGKWLKKVIRFIFREYFLLRPAALGDSLFLPFLKGKKFAENHFLLESAMSDKEEPEDSNKPLNEHLLKED